MEKDIRRLHALITYYDSIGAWGLAAALRKVLLACAVVALSACSSTITKRWHVHPDDVARFEGDQQRCAQFARGSRYSEELFDSCLQQVGYRLEIIRK